jgi:hypothetical protein
MQNTHTHPVLRAPCSPTDLVNAARTQDGPFTTIQVHVPAGAYATYEPAQAAELVRDAIHSGLDQPFTIASQINGDTVTTLLVHMDLPAALTSIAEANPTPTSGLHHAAHAYLTTVKNGAAA